jgi:hypothetical protein
MALARAPALAASLGRQIEILAGAADCENRGLLGLGAKLDRLLVCGFGNGTIAPDSRIAVPFPSAINTTAFLYLAIVKFNAW